ncbi:MULTISPECIES: hypothetical protein [unclassified Helicobacter]|uniref:hypothetical protein n=1 Tax=unclassified Helicobacter TaxID=2593540 RepID=UPI000CF10098|nr:MULTISPECIES: hypothetical protein [unclassified Helicobacter]
MRVAIQLVPIIVLFLMSGCSSVFDIKPNQSYNFLQGKKVLLSKQKDSEVRLEIAQDVYIQNTPFMLLITAKAKDIIFDFNHIKLLQDNDTILPLAPKEILSSGYNFKNSLENFNIPTPPIASSQRSNIFFTLYGGIFFLNNNDDLYFKESEFSRKILLSNYLKKTTLNTDNFLGGFVVFLPKKIIDNKTFKIEVVVGEDKHYFSFELTSKESKKHDAQ